MYKVRVAAVLFLLILIGGGCLKPMIDVDHMAPSAESVFAMWQKDVI